MRNNKRIQMTTNQKVLIGVGSALFLGGTIWFYISKFKKETGIQINIKKKKKPIIRESGREDVVFTDNPDDLSFLYYEV
jgi:hypothetical protein